MVAVAVQVMILHLGSAGRGGSDGCCKRKNGEQLIEALYGHRQNNRNVPYAIYGYPLVGERYTQRSTNKGTASRVLGLENAPFQ